MSRARAAWVALWALTASACTFDPPAPGFLLPDADRLPLDGGALGADAGDDDASTAVDAGFDDASAPDAAPTDTGAPDAGFADATPADTGTPDAGFEDARVPDTGAPDALPVDTGTPDAGFMDASAPDASPDAGPPHDAGFPYPVSNVTVPPRPPPGQITLAPQQTCILDTSVPNLTGVGCPVAGDLSHATQTTGHPIALWNVDVLVISQQAWLDIVGDRPLVIVAHDDVLLEGFVNLSGHRDSSGPGAYPTTCGGSRGGDGTDGNGAGGGANANDGGDGGDRISSPASGGARGLPRTTPALVPLLGGCPGGNAGASPNGAAGGGGGGALQVSAADVLRFSGELYAVGGGGQVSASVQTGGGGGGAGGSVLLEADRLEVVGAVVLMAGGGGGGEGTGSDIPQPGADGSFFSDSAAPGGNGPGNGGVGGTGGTTFFSGFSGGLGPRAGGGGGGGGGAGRFRFNANMCVVNTSPQSILTGEISSNGTCSLFP